MNHWLVNSWTQNGWDVTRDTCTNCGLRFDYFTTVHAKETLPERREAHERECWKPDPRCPYATDAVPQLRCVLPAGHPTGPQYSWFTDDNGHILEA